MEGSSDTGRKKSDNSRGSDALASSDRNLQVHHASRVSLSADTLQDSLFEDGRELRGQAGQAPGDHFINQVVASGVNKGERSADPLLCSIESSDVSLRQWLDNPARQVDAAECQHILRQIVEIVSTSHSQGIIVNNVRPSCFVMSSINRVSFIESASCSDSDSPEEGSNHHSREVMHLFQDWPEQRGTSIDKQSHPDSCDEKASSWTSGTRFLYSNANQRHVPSGEEREEETKGSENLQGVEEKKQPFPMKALLLMEINWYTSPEEIAGAPSSCASDIYRLGVLLFELFCTFSSSEERNNTMSSLRHRVLPPHLLLKWPKEASFCLWLLHPDPSSRPKMGELLQSDFLNKPRDDIKENESEIELTENIEEQELLLEFLRLMRQTKQDAFSRLQDIISLLSSDIEQVLNKQRALKQKGGFSPRQEEAAHLSYSYLPLSHMIEPVEVASLSQRKRGKQVLQILEHDSHTSHSHALKMGKENQGSLLFRHSRLIENFKKLESSYLLTRCKSSSPSGKLLAGQYTISSNSKVSAVLTESGWVSPFLEGLCKYLSFTKLRVKADLKQGDLLSSSNLICSVSFDRDGEFFAAAGVNKKIKVFECDSILNEDCNIHYPLVEMASRSKLSSVCWNSYIKNQMASSNFEGVVQVWDVTRGQVFIELKEHQNRIWSVDFSLADPTILASGGDDGCVKLWSINQGASIGTIKTKANVCCVQFPLDSGRTFAFGSADHKVYYYDLRNPKVPLFTLTGHSKTVSYIKFVNSTNLVSASTDNTIKLWDLSMCTSRILDSPLQSFTGHVNVKNFVGLSVSDGYIATGSETNEVFVYHKAFPMPALSFKFSSKDPSHDHYLDDTTQFISSVCWRGHSSTLVAANSTGAIKILEMV